MANENQNLVHMEEGPNTKAAREVLGKDESLTMQIEDAVAQTMGTHKKATPWSEQTADEKKKTVFWGVVKFISVLALLYLFLIGLGLMGNGFKVAAGRAGGNLFEFADNPVAGLMVGIFATVLVQSSSTSTSIVVALVAADVNALPVDDAIPIIMGANIGTSVTNTIVSMAHAKVPREFARAFAGATVHDFFNILSVLILLPLEVITGFLEALTGEIVDGLLGSDGAKFKSPTKYFVSPVTDGIVKVDKKKIKSIAEGKEVTGSLIKGGWFNDSGMSDTVAGIIIIVLSLILLVGALIMLVKVLNSIMRGTAANMIKRVLDMHPIVAMIMGMGITMSVQSSSITTSTLVPLVGINVITLEAMFPLTLGANVGTTLTAFLAAIQSGKKDSLQIALCHLFFNLCGIIIWYPLPFMRAIPLALARQLGFSVARHRIAALGYTFTVFVIIPLIFIGLSEGGTGVLLGVGIPFFLLIGAACAYMYIRTQRPELIPESWPEILQSRDNEADQLLRRQLEEDEEARQASVRAFKEGNKKAAQQVSISSSEDSGLHA